MLENRANNFLALGAEVIDALWKINRWCLCLTASGGPFHAARELRKTIGKSTSGLEFDKFSRTFARYFSELAALVASPGATMGWRKGIMARSLGPSCSTGWLCSRCRVARKLGQPFSFSSIHFLAKLPSRISERILRISSRVLDVMMRGTAE